MPHRFQFGEFDDLLDRLAMRLFLTPDRWQEQRLGQNVGAEPRVTRCQQVVDHAHFAEQFAMLKGSRQPGTRHF